jgi:TolB-like protein
MATNAGIQVEERGALIARASLFGPFALTDQGGTPITVSNRRARAVLSILCLEPGQPVTREQLTRLLWPGRFEAQAKASLRQCLLELGKALEPLEQPLLVVTRERVALTNMHLRTDLSDLETALMAGRYQEAIALLDTIGSRRLLDDLNVGDAFADWLEARRKQVSLRLQALVERALDNTGDAALRKRLLGAWAVRQPSGAPAAMPIPTDSKTRIAVLPFKSLGSADGPDYFTDGMVDELITTLGQVPQLLVAGRTSSFHFRDSPLAPAQIAGELGVTHLIEGSVQRQGEQVRIHVHLIAGDTGFEHWGQRFDGSLDSIFRLQENVAQAVTRALAEALNLEMAAPLVRTMTGSKKAFDLYLQGRSLNARLFGDGVLDKAVELLQQAVAIDPQFAEAWVELAEVHHNISVWTQCLDRNAEALRMAECANKAIALAPQLGYPRALLAIYEWTRNNIVGAMDLVFEAYRREPTHPGVAMRVGSFLLYLGRTSDAAPYVMAAIEQDPVDTRKFALLIAVHMHRGEFEAAVQVGQRSVELGFPSVQQALAIAATGQHDMAVEQYQLTKKLVNTIVLPPVGSGPMTDEAMDAYWLVAAKGVCSGQEADRLIYHQLLNMMYATLHDKADMAIVGPAIMTGHVELVFKSFGLHLTPANMVWLSNLWIDIDPIRQIWQHTEFIPFAQRIGLAAAWDKYGWPDLPPPPSNRA